MKIFIIILSLLLVRSFGQTILIDPGHGGNDLGATQKMGKKNKKSIFEKDLALKLAKKVKEKLGKKYSTHLTRKTDKKISLEDRSQMAETLKADLFISIHFNSSTEKKSSGFETFYLDNHNDIAVKKMESVENDHIHEDEEKIVNQILIDLVISQTVPSSKLLASSIHEKIKNNTAKKYKIRDRGIRPGLFYVLALSKRPGVLIEAGFMSNKKELSIIQKEKYLNRYARDIAHGINAYFSKKEKLNTGIF